MKLPTVLCAMVSGLPLTSHLFSPPQLAALSVFPLADAQQHSSAGCRSLVCTCLRPYLLSMAQRPSNTCLTPPPFLLLRSFWRQTCLLEASLNMWEGSGETLIKFNIDGVPTHFAALRWVAWFLCTPVSQMHAMVGVALGHPRAAPVACGAWLRLSATAVLIPPGRALPPPPTRSPR